MRPRGDAAIFENYRTPLLSHARSHIRPGRLTEEDAEDCISEFFAEFTGGKLSAYRSAGGSFRSYLLGALNHRISTFIRDANAKKRGGGIEHLSLDESTDIPTPAALAQLAAALDIDTDSVNRAIAALRTAFGRCLRLEVRETLQNPTEGPCPACLFDLAIQPAASDDHWQAPATSSWTG